MSVESVRALGFVLLVSFVMGCGLFPPRPAWEETPPRPPKMKSSRGIV